MTPIETIFASLTTNDALLLISAGGLVAAIAIINNLVRTIFRRGEVGFLDLLLTFGGVLLPVIGLTIANVNDTPDTIIGDVVVWIAAALVFTHVIILLLELLRPPRWKGSRGLLGVFSGGLLVAATFGIPFIAAFTSINAGLRMDPPPDVVETGADGEIVVPAEAESRIVEMFRMILSFIAEDIDMEPIAVAEAIDDGIPLATLINDRGGDVEGVIRRITAVTRDSIRASAAAGEINALQAALFVSQAEPLVRLIVNNDVNTLGQRFGGPTPDPDATRARLADIFQPTPTPDEALIAIAPTNTPTATATVTPTITPTPSPTLTATPSLTPTPSPTRFVFATRAPRGDAAAGSTIAPAAGDPAAPDGAVCFASVTNNLRLRAAQAYTSETLVVIPFTARIELYGRGRNIDAEASWWLARYEGDEGFVDGSFLLLDSNCQNLPYRGG